MLRSISLEHKKNWNWLLGFLQSSLNLLCLPSEHMLRLKKSNTNCVFATQKLHISLAPPLSSRKNYVEIEINTRQCSHCLFQCFCSVAAGKTDAKVKQANAEKWISSSLEPILLNAEKIVLKLTRDNVCIAFLLKTFQCFSPSLIIPSKCFFPSLK